MRDSHRVHLLILYDNPDLYVLHNQYATSNLSRITMIRRQVIYETAEEPSENSIQDIFIETLLRDRLNIE